MMLLLGVHGVRHGLPAHHALLRVVLRKLVLRVEAAGWAHPRLHHHAGHLTPVGVHPWGRLRVVIPARLAP